MQSPCCRSTLGQIKKQTGGTEGGEKGRDKFIEAAAVQAWLCNWPRDCGLEGDWFFLKWRRKGIVETVQRHSRVERGCRKWMYLKTVILSEECQTKKQKYLTISFI